MNSARLGIVLLQAILLASCAALQANQKQLSASSLPSDAVASTVNGADLRARSPAPMDDRTGQSNDRPAAPMLFPGTEPDSVAPATSDPGSRQRIASAEPVAIRGDGVEMNFEGTDISSAAKTLLGDILHQNFQIDPRVQGTITLASVGPVARKDVLAAFESALRMQNAAIVRDGGFIKIVPISEASAHTSISMGAGEPGFGVSVVPLRYVSATSAAKTAENMGARAGSIRADPGRNLLLVQGTESERQSAIDVISTFDVEWLRDQSVGVFPLKSTSPETMIADLERVFATSEGGPGQGVIQFQPIARMNAVMVVTKNPNYLKQTTQWVQRLDRADTSGTMVRTYRLRYGNAADVAKMIANIFSDQSGGANDTPANQVVPGVSTAESRLASLDKGSQNSGLTTQTSGAAGATGGGATPIAAAFDGFSSQKSAGNSKGGQQQSAAAFPFSGNVARGILEGVRITPDTTNNAILVYSNQEQYRVVERALRDVDRPRLSVAIDATVAEVTLTNGLQYGVQYFLANNNGSISLFDAAQTIGSAVLKTASPGFNAVLGSQANPKVVLNLLSSVTDVRVLSSPSIVALDNQPALLQVGDEVPVSTGTATVLTGANTPIINQIQLVNTGVILKVLPHVNSNGSIELEIDQEVSSVPNNGTNQQTLTPTISQRRIHSTIAVMSGQTVLLGGLISDNTQNGRNGIPGLSNLGPFGALFSTTDGTRTRSEVIIFVRPQLIRNSVDARAVTQEFRDRLMSMRSTRSIVKGDDLPARMQAGPATQ